MKNSGLLLITSLALLQGCGDRSSGNGKSENKFVLGAFFDTEGEGSFNERGLQNIPRTVNLRPDITPVKNQSDRGTCTFFASIALAEAVFKKSLKRDVNFSEEYLTAITKAEGHFSFQEGSFSSVNIPELVRSGLMLESDWPYRPSTFGKGYLCENFAAAKSQAPQHCFFALPPENHIQARKVDASALETVVLPHNTNEIIKYIARERNPVVVGLPVNFNGWTNSGITRHDPNLHTECLNNPSSCGMHEVLIYGYDLTKKVFFFKNSWGKTWGREGHGEIDINSVDKYAIRDSFISLRAKGALRVPQDLAAQKAVLGTFTPNSQEMSDGSIQVTVNGQVRNTLGYVFYTSSGLAKITRAGAPQDSNTEMVSLTPAEAEQFGDTYVRAIWSDNIEGTEESISWDNQQVSISSELVASETAQRMLGPERNKLTIRTTLFVHTDTDKFKVLKRVYHPLRAKTPARN